MVIAGLQKLTLLDYPGYTACTIFTKGCNFRCHFCHNSALVENKPSEIISEAEVFDFLQSRRGKLDGVCISGGEPTLQSDICEFASKIKDMGFLVKIDTNGSNFEVLKALVQNKLCDYVAMDIKTSLANYSKIAGAEVDVSEIQKSISFLLSSSIPYEFRTTVVHPYHWAQDFYDIAKLIAGAEKYYLQQFKDSGAVLDAGCSAYNAKEMQEFLQIVKNNGVPNAFIRGMDL